MKSASWHGSRQWQKIESRDSEFKQFPNRDRQVASPHADSQQSPGHVFLRGLCHQKALGLGSRTKSMPQGVSTPTGAGRTPRTVFCRSMQSSAMLRRRCNRAFSFSICSIRTLAFLIEVPHPAQDYSDNAADCPRKSPGGHSTHPASDRYAANPPPTFATRCDCDAANP
jgi:hypothetical protein